MTRKAWAILLLVVGCLSLAAFYLRLSEPRITEAELVLSATATLAGGWGIALLVPDRLHRWSIRYMAVMTPIVLVITVVFIVSLPE